MLLVHVTQSQNIRLSDQANTCFSLMEEDTAFVLLSHHYGHNIVTSCGFVTSS